MPQSRSSNPRLTGCVKSAELFQHQLLEEPPTANATAEVRRHALSLERAAEELCRSCPLLRSCLFRAVVEHDVAGFVAGTTVKERSAIRRLLGVRVAAEDFDTLAGVLRDHRQVDHDEVVRLHRANPTETYEQLAQRLGCSLSTVKRHLRLHRAGEDDHQVVQPARPTQAEVLAAYVEVTGAAWTGDRSAA